MKRQAVALLPRAKAGARPLILSGEVQKLLRDQLERRDGEWVFPGPDGRRYSRVHVTRVFRKASQGAGLRDFRFHDLRQHGPPWPSITASRRQSSRCLAAGRRESAVALCAIGIWLSVATAPSERSSH